MISSRHKVENGMTGGEYFHETFVRLFALVANKRFVKIFTPALLCNPRGVFANLRVTFKLLLLNSDRTTIMGGFFLPSTNNISNFWIRTILQWSTLGYCNLIGIIGNYRAEKRRAIKMAAIWQNIEGHNIEDKMHCTVSKVDETFFEIFFSHL
jgi:hypothetical protein